MEFSFIQLPFHMAAVFKWRNFLVHAVCKDIVGTEEKALDPELFHSDGVSCLGNAAAFT